MANDITQAIGTTGKYVVTAQNLGVPILNDFDGTESLLAEIFEGDGQQVLLNPATSWAVPASGTINVIITAAQLTTAALTPGIYALRVIVTSLSDSQPREVGTWEILFTPGPGTDAAPKSYASYRDLFDYFPELDKLQSKNRDLTEFARQRQAAFYQTIRRILDQYRPVYGRARRMYDATMTTTGPNGPSYLTAVDLANPTFAAPTPAQVKAWLQTGGLIANADVIEFNARWAAWLVYGDQPGADNRYQQQAQQQLQKAEMAWARAKSAIEIDTNADGVAEIRLDRDVIWLT